MHTTCVLTLFKSDDYGFSMKTLKLYLHYIKYSYNRQQILSGLNAIVLSINVDCVIPENNKAIILFIDTGFSRHINGYLIAFI